MSLFSRSLVAVVAGLSLLGVSSCALGGQGGGTGADPSDVPNSETGGAGLEAFDPCTFFKPEELTAAGVSTEAKDFTQVSFQPGCTWDGKLLSVALQKNADESLESLGAGAWDEFTRIQVGGRDAARVIPSGAMGQGVCNVVVSSGGGVVIYQLTGYMRDSVADPCGEIEKIAEQTASRLPE